MNNTVFNTAFEISMRLLLVLSLSKKKRLTIDSLVTADFISNYSKEFGLSSSNLHGDNEFSFSEFSTRRALAQDAIKQLVLENMIGVSYSKDGFQYSVSERGRTLGNSRLLIMPLNIDYMLKKPLHIWTQKTKKNFST